MIYGVGIDIAKVERIRKAVEKWGEKFLKRVFTEGEIAYCYGKKNPFPSLAVRFAAKEAFVKAIGHSVPFTDIEVTNGESGKPLIRQRGRLHEFFLERSISGAHVSLSHEREFAIACVVLEKE